MSQASADYAREKSARSLDTIRVHNPTSEDYVFWDDKLGPTAKKSVVPKAQQDIGKGKGNNDLPRYLAKRYTKAMVEQIITKTSDAEWEKKKKQYRTRDEMLQHAEVEPTRTNDPKQWEELFPKIWLGVVEKWGGADIEEPTDKTVNYTGNPMEDAMNRLALDDKQYENSQTETT